MNYTETETETGSEMKQHCIIIFFVCVRFNISIISYHFTILISDNVFRREWKANYKEHN